MVSLLFGKSIFFLRSTDHMQQAKCFADAGTNYCIHAETTKNVNTNDGLYETSGNEVVPTIVGRTVYISTGSFGLVSISKVHGLYNRI